MSTKRSLQYRIQHLAIMDTSKYTIAMTPIYGFHDKGIREIWQLKSYLTFVYKCRPRHREAMTLKYNMRELFIIRELESQRGIETAVYIFEEYFLSTIRYDEEVFVFL